MDNYLSIANSPLMFILCAVVVAYVVIQSVLFMRKAWRRGLEIGLTPAKMKKAVAGSALFSIVPSIPILIILVMLMSVLGQYFPWLRLSVIGSSSYENVAATVAARAFGLVAYTDPGYNSSIFVSTMWAMTICIMYSPILIVFGFKWLDRGLGKIRDTRPVFFALLINGIFIAMMGWFCAPFLTGWLEAPDKILSLVALLVAAACALIFIFLAKKTKKSILMDMAFPGGMLLGMAGAYICNQLIA